MITDRGLVLFISPAFFGYEIAICNAIEENGYAVDFFDERTSNNSFFKAVFRVRKSLLNSAINRYYKHILNKISKKRYTHFFLIKGEVVPIWFIKEFKKLNPLAKLIYYTYDSFNNNNQNSIYILKHFDSCYSFDFKDVENNSIFKLKHLFFTNEFLTNSDFADRKYTASFVGTLHSARYKIVKELFAKIDNTFVFFYSPAKWFFKIEKLLKKDHKSIDSSEVSFKKISGEEVAEIFKSSKAVLDIQRSGQTGLTMRTFEVLAAGAILITTNSYIKQTAFYDPQYIVVLNDLEEHSRDFREIISQRKTPDKALFNNSDAFFINNWVKDFF